MSDALPQGWATTNLDEVCFVITDGTHQTPNYVAKGVPFVSTTNLRPFSVGFDFSEYIRFISPEDHAALTKRCKPEKGDILVSKCGTIGRVKEVDVDFSFSIFVGLALLKPHRGAFYPRFAEFWLNCPSVTEQFEELSPGSTRRTLTLKGIKSVVIPMPPLSEQRRIVVKLERLLARMEACQKRLAKIPVILKRFRQSVLAAACSGRLTADWREEHTNVDPYSVEVQPDSDDVDNSGEFPPSWRTTTLGALTTLVTSGSRGWAQYYSDSGSIFVRAQNINMDVLNMDEIAFVKLPKHAEGLRTKVQEHDLLMTITGANVTKSALVDRHLKDAYVSRHVALVRLADVRLSRFVFYSIISLAHGRKQLQNAAYGQGKPGLNLDNIRDVVVGLPPLEEQQEIVRRVEVLFALADQIQVRYEKAKAYVDKLTQSILAKAFRGELVPQDPTDEPASVLLERIHKIKTSSS